MDRNCDRLPFSLSDYLDNRLTPAEDQVVEKHMKECARCRTEWTQLQRVQALLKTAPAQRPSEAFYQRVLRKAREKETPRARIPRPWAFPLKTLATASVLGVVLLATREKRKANFKMTKAPVSRESTTANLTHKKRKPAELKTLSTINAPIPEPFIIRKADLEKQQLNENAKLQPPEPISMAAPSQPIVVAQAVQAKETFAAAASNGFQNNRLEMNTKGQELHGVIGLAAGGALAERPYGNTSSARKDTTPSVRFIDAQGNPIVPEGWTLRVARSAEEWNTLWNQQMNRTGASQRDVAPLFYPPPSSAVIAALPNPEIKNQPVVEFGRTLPQQDKIVIEYRQRPRRPEDGPAPFTYRVIPRNDLPIVLQRIP